MPDQPKPDFTSDGHSGEKNSRHHPDDHALLDWGLYGPRDTRIEQLVWRLAKDHGLRLAEIESLIVDTLEKRLSKIKGG